MSPPTVSIIVPVIIHNEQLLRMTQKCLAHIGHTTRAEEVEIIVVDNGSPQPAYFRPDITIKNRTNIGYGPAVNQGIKLSRGRYIVPMNNDVFVKPGWLEPLLAELDRDQTLGVIRPIQIGAGAYRADSDPPAGVSVKHDRIDFHGACYVMPRRVIDAIGLFDEQFVPGYCEDMDMWVRLTNAGYRMAKHYGSHVQHLGGATSAQTPIGAAMNDNRRRFKAKWGFDPFSPEWYSEWRELRARFGDI